ncbi:collagen alpha-1(I) chain-like [Capricornis sumatraensis]|uniref:collagen alpha-1(I) chain-like n=1 Tax=Capricornis sumatraensis TaxID=34865 RepID=UPI003605407B
MKTAGGGRRSRPKALPRAAALGGSAAGGCPGRAGPARRLRSGPPPASARPGQARHTPAAGRSGRPGARRRLHRRLHRRRRRRFGGAGRGGRGGACCCCCCLQARSTWCHPSQAASAAAGHCGIARFWRGPPAPKTNKRGRMDPFPGAKTRSPRERRCQRVTSGGGACAIYGSGRPSPRPSPPPPPPPRSPTDCLTAPRAGPSPASPASPAAAQRRRRPQPRAAAPRAHPPPRKFLLAQISLQSRQTGSARLQPGPSTPPPDISHTSQSTGRPVPRQETPRGGQADTVEIAQARRYRRSSLRAQSAPRGQTDAQGPARAGPDLRWKPRGPPRRRPPLRAPRSTRFARVALAPPSPPPPRRAVTLKRQRPQPLEPRSGSGLQGAGPRPRLAADPRHHRRQGQAVQPRGARAQARSGVPAGRAVPGPPRRAQAAARAPSPPPAPTTHPREGAGVSSRARRELPPRVSPVPGPPRPRGAGLVSGSQAGAGLRAIQKLRPSAARPHVLRARGSRSDRAGDPASSPAPGPAPQAELGKRTRKRRARLTLGTGEREAPGHSGRVRLLQADPKDREGLDTPSEKVQAPLVKAAKFDKQRLLGGGAAGPVRPAHLGLTDPVTPGARRAVRPPPGPNCRSRVSAKSGRARAPGIRPGGEHRARSPQGTARSQLPGPAGPRKPAGPLSTASPESLAPSGPEDAERASALAELPLRNTLGRRIRAGKDGSCVPGVPRIRKGKGAGVVEPRGAGEQAGTPLTPSSAPTFVHALAAAQGSVYTSLLLRKSVEVGDSGQARSVRSLNYLSCWDPDKEAGKAGSPARARPGGARLPSLAWGQGAIYGRRALRAPPPPPSPRRNPRRLPPPPALAPSPLRDACHLSQLHRAPRASLPMKH